MTFKRSLSISILGFLAGGATLLIFPTVPVRWAADRWAPPRGWTVHFESIRGNPLTGYRVRSVDLRGPGVSLTARSVFLAPDWPAIIHHRGLLQSVEADTPVLRWRPMTGEKSAPAAEGEFASPGDPLLTPASRIAVRSGTLYLAGAPPLRGVDADVLVSSQGVHVPRVTLRVVEHAVAAHGSVSFAPLRWDASASWTGPIAGSGETRGSTDSWRAKAALRNGSGLAADLQVRAKDGVLQGSGGLRGRGRVLDSRPDISFESIAATVTVRGPLAGLRWSVDGAYANASIRGIRSAHGDLSARGRGLPPRDVKGRLSIQDVEMPDGRRVEETEAELRGSLSDHRFSFDARSSEISIFAEGRGRLLAGAWDAEWRVLNARWKNAWHIPAPFKSSIAPGRVSIDGFALTSDQGTLRLDGTFRPKGLSRIRLRAEGLALEPLHTHGWVKEPLSGRATLEADVSGTPMRPDGVVHFAIDDLSFRDRPVGRVEGRLRWIDGALLWEEVQLLSPGGRLITDGRIPWPAREAQKNFTLRLRSEHFDPAPLTETLFQTRLEEGDLSGDIRLTRREGTFSAEGALRLSAARLRPREWKEEFRRVSFGLSGQGEALAVEAAAEAKDGRLLVSGAVSSEGPDLRLEGRRVPFRAAGFAGMADADMAFDGLWDRPRLAGNIFVIQATDVPPAKEKKKDRQEKKKEEVPPADSRPSAFALDLTLRAERNVWYKRGDTAVELKADLKAEKAPYESPRLYGTVESLRGDAFFYGRRFKIESGSAFFAGENPPDPALSVRGVHSAADIDVTLLVGGTMRHPQLTLSSSPPLEEADIISVLATGRPLSTLTGGSGAAPGRDEAEAAAQGLVSGYLSGKIEDRLRNRVPVDVLRVGVGQEGNADLTVGKNVTDRLYVAFEQTLGADGERRLRSEYVLKKWLNLEGSSGSGNYVVDLLFKLGFR